MAWDLTAIVADQPGAMAKVGEAVGSAGVNIEGITCVTTGGVGIVHLLVEDPESASSALEGAGISVLSRREVLVVGIEDRPGELGRISRRLADAGVNIELVYLATGTRLALAVDDVERATELL